MEPLGSRYQEGSTDNRQAVTIKQAPYSGLTDSGGQTTCAGMGLVRTLGLGKEDLMLVTMSLNTAVEAEMLIMGVLFIEIVGVLAKDFPKL